MSFERKTPTTVCFLSWHTVHRKDVNFEKAGPTGRALFVTGVSGMLSNLTFQSSAFHRYLSALHSPEVACFWQSNYWVTSKLLQHRSGQGLCLPTLPGHVLGPAVSQTQLKRQLSVQLQLRQARPFLTGVGFCFSR